MLKQFVILLLGIFLIGTVSALTQPTIYSVTPKNNTILPTGAFIFGSNITAVDVGDSLINNTLFVWNSSGQEINRTTLSLSADYNATNVSVYLPRGDGYTWNFFGCDGALGLSDCGWSSNRNFSLIYLASNITQTGELLIPNTDNVNVNYVTLKKPVNSTNSFVLLSKVYSSSSGNGGNNVFAYANLVNSTTINITRASPTLNSTLYVTWTVVSDDRINVYRNTTLIPSANNFIVFNMSQAINNLSNTFLTLDTNWVGTAGTQITPLFVEGIINNATQLKFIKNVTFGAQGTNIHFQVVSWKGANVQNGTTITNSTGAKTSITSINVSNSWLYFTTSSNGSSSSINNNTIQGILNSNSVDFLKFGLSGASAGSAGTDNPEASWYVISAPFFNIQNGNASWGGATIDVNLTSPVNTSRGFAWGSTTSSSTSNNAYQMGFAKVNLTNGTLVQLQQFGGQTRNTTWFTINIQNDISTGNTCTYSGSGNWNILWSDLCIITTNNNLGGANITITGTTGYCVFDGGNITNYKFKYMSATNGTSIFGTKNGGGFK